MEFRRVLFRSDCVWHGRDIARSTRWVRDLTPADIAEIDAALQQVKRRGLAWHEVTSADFPLTGATELLDGVADDLENGLGIRSDERRVGKECVSTCTSRCTPEH